MSDERNLEMSIGVRDVMFAQLEKKCVEVIGSGASWGDAINPKYTRKTTVVLYSEDTGLEKYWISPFARINQLSSELGGSNDSKEKIWLVVFQGKREGACRIGSRELLSVEKILDKPDGVKPQ